MESRQVLPKLNRFCSDLHRIPGSEDVPKRVAVMVAELTNAPYSELWFRDEDTESIRLTSVNDESFLSDDVPRALLVGQCIVGEIIATGTLRVCPDLLKVPSWTRRDWTVQKGLTSFLGVPLFIGNRAMGALSIMSSNRSQLGPLELQILQFFADQTSVAMLRKQTELALKESEEKNRIFFDATLDAVVTIDASGQITGWNAQAEATLGWPREEVINLNVYETIIPPSCREEYATWLTHFMNGNGGQTNYTRIDMTALHRDGSEVPVELTITQVGIGSSTCFALVLRSIRERKDAVEKLNAVHGELAETRRNLFNIVDISPEPIISTNENGSITLFSKSAEALFGYEGGDIIGNDIESLYENDEGAVEVINLMRESGGKVSDYELNVRTKDGDLVPVSITASILYDDEGTEAGTVGFQKDLRESKRMQEELRGANEELRRAEEALKAAQSSVIAAEKLAALGRLTAGVSHEILNPLNIITLRLHMMIKDPEVPADVSRHLRVLDDQATRISKIAQDLLYFARQRDPERRSLNINSVVERTLGLLEHDLRQSNVTVELRLASKLPSVKADEDQLQQVVLNLLTNARDALPQGGMLFLGTYEVEHERQRYVELRVEDTGSGIDPDNLGRIFDPFFTTKAEGEGTGLGLAICKGIIESHGGTIWAEQSPSGGAAFIIRLALE